MKVTLNQNILLKRTLNKHGNPLHFIWHLQ